jgi:molybdopterin synthase catalytic subunit
MRARVLFFGMLKELAGCSAEEVEFPEGMDLRGVFEYYAARHPSLRDMARSIVVARNQEFADLSTRIAEGDEVKSTGRVIEVRDGHARVFAGDYDDYLRRRES